MTDSKNYEYITNEELYNLFPTQHEMVTENSPVINEANYPQVEGFTMLRSQDGTPVEFHQVHWADGSNTPLTGQ